MELGASQKSALKVIVSNPSYKSYLAEIFHCQVTFHVFSALRYRKEKIPVKVEPLGVPGTNQMGLEPGRGARGPPGRVDLSVVLGAWALLQPREQPAFHVCTAYPVPAVGPGPVLSAHLLCSDPCSLP